MRDTTSNMAIKDITQYIYTTLNEGKSLTYSLARQPKHFTEGDVSIIKS
jgi:type II secretory pathway component PulF